MREDSCCKDVNGESGRRTGNDNDSAGVDAAITL